MQHITHAAKHGGKCDPSLLIDCCKVEKPAGRHMQKDRGGRSTRATAIDDTVDPAYSSTDHIRSITLGPSCVAGAHARSFWSTLTTFFFLLWNMALPFYRQLWWTYSRFAVVASAYAVTLVFFPSWQPDQFVACSPFGGLGRTIGYIYIVYLSKFLPRT
jgi:hypothetical protein